MYADPLIELQTKAIWLAISKKSSTFTQPYVFVGYAVFPIQ